MIGLRRLAGMMLFGEGAAAGAVRIAGGRVEKADVQAAEVPGALRIGGHGRQLGEVRPLFHALPTREEEQLVASNRSAHRAAVVIDDVFRQRG